MDVHILMALTGVVSLNLSLKYLRLFPGRFSHFFVFFFQTESCYLGMFWSVSLYRVYLHSGCFLIVV